MQILSAEQIRAWDEFTMQKEKINSIDLMERAAAACVQWLRKNGYGNRNYAIFCGKGNNGGDGLAMARLLARQEEPVTVYILESGYKGTADFQTNLQRLHETNAHITFIQAQESFPHLQPETLIIDALLGSGLNRSLEGVTAALAVHLNHSGCQIISIDIPSGLFTDKSTVGNPAVHATHTLAFQCYKPAFLMAENALATGTVHFLDIGLSNTFFETISPEFILTGKSLVTTLLKPRNAFANKGNFGHALLVAGGYGKMGAAVLAARSCLRSGAGLVTVHVPKCGYEIIQVSIPEAMVTVDADEKYCTGLEEDSSTYAVTGIGPGIGKEPATAKLLKELFLQSKKPMVVDADALNILAADRTLFDTLPPCSVLTPHPKEFDRLFEESANDFERVQKAREKSKHYQCVIVLKGHHTFIALPDGKGYFNSTGNAGMAKGGSGDILTGIITGFVAQGYRPAHAAIIGVYLHGLAGDFAAAEFSQEAMMSSDIIACMSKAFQAVGRLH